MPDGARGRPPGHQGPEAGRAPGGRTSAQIVAAWLVAFAAATGAAAAAPPAGSGGRVPVLVELYTSQGCSSCPAADEVLRELELTQSIEGIVVVPLSLHVDYWNRLGWRDPYSDAAFSARQMLYADREGRRYTPQMVVDGGTRFLGSSRTKARRAILEAAARPKARLDIGAERLSDGRVRLEVTGEGQPEGDGELLVHLALTRGELGNEVRRGENAGRRLAHAAVVLSLATLGPVRGGHFAAETVVELEAVMETHAVVAFAQESGGERRVLSLGTLSLAPLEGAKR